MTALKLTRIGNSVGVILPREMLARLKLEKGDTVFVTDTAGSLDEAAFARWLRRYAQLRQSG